MPKPMHKSQAFHLFLILTGCLWASTSAYAADTAETTDQETQKYYDVEIILFKNLSAAKGKELNLPTPSPVHRDATLDLSNPDSIALANEKGFTPLKDNELTLQDLVLKIINSSNFSLLTHTGWRQPGLDTAGSVPVWIKGGRIFGNEYSSIDQSDAIFNPQTTENTDIKPADAGSETVAAADHADKPVTSSPETMQDVLYEIEGQIIITLSRYLHTQANLVLRKPADTQSLIQHEPDIPSDNSSLETPEGHLLQNYGLNEKRRMRSRKLHYLDNPQFGMLVQITPYEKPLEESPVTAPDSKAVEN